MAERKAEKEPPYIFMKCVLVGEPGVGKTSIFKRLQFKPEGPVDLSLWRPEDERDNPVDYCTVPVECMGRNVEVRIWDPGDFWRYTGGIFEFMRRADIVLMVYDITNQSSLKCLDFWYEDAKAYCFTPCLMVLGNKCDLGGEFRKVTMERGAEIAREFGASNHMEISAKNNINVQQALSVAVANALGPPLISRFSKTLSDNTLSRDVARAQVALVGPFGAGKSNLAMNFIKPGFQENSDSTPGVSFLRTAVVINTNCQPGSHEAEVGPLLESVVDSAVTTMTVIQAATQSSPQEETATQSSPQEETATKEAEACRAPEMTLLERVRNFFRKLFVMQREVSSAACDDFQSSSSTSKAQPSLPFDQKSVQEELLMEIKERLIDPQEAKIFIDLLDCGGQLSFSILQALCFNPGQTIFMLVYNSSIPLSARLLEMYRHNGCHVPSLSVELSHGDYLSLWLSTLSMVAGPLPSSQAGGLFVRSPIVIVVGTHRGQCSSEQLQESDAAVHHLLRNFCDSPLQIFGPYHVDNSCPRDDDMRLLRHKVYQIVQNTASFHETPLSYLKVDWLIKYLVKRGRLQPCMTLQAFSEFVEEAAGFPKQEVPRLLDYLHCNCVVRSFHHNTTPASAQVFLDTDWFLTQITKIISCSMMEVDTEVPISCRADITDYLKGKGILTSRLCKHLWSDLEPAVWRSLLQTMEEFGLQCPAADRSCYGIPRDAGDLYHVPACIQRTTPALIPMPSDSVSLPEVLFHFTEKFFPFAVYTRLIVLLLQCYRPHQPEIDFCQVRFCCDAMSHCYFAEITHLAQGVAVSLVCTNAVIAAGEKQPYASMASVAAHLLQSVNRLLQRLRGESLPGLNWCLAFKCQDHIGTNLSDVSWVIAADLEVYNTAKNSIYKTSLPGSYLAASCMPRHSVAAPRNFHCWLTSHAVFQLKGVEPVGRDAQPAMTTPANDGSYVGRPGVHADFATVVGEGHILRKNDEELYGIAFAVVFTWFQLHEFANFLLVDCNLSGDEFLGSLDKHVYPSPASQVHAVLKYWIESSPGPKYVRSAGQLQVALERMGKGNVISKFLNYFDGKGTEILSQPSFALLMEVAKAIPDHWTSVQLAIALDIGDNEVKKVQHSAITDELVFNHVLTKWLEVKGPSATKKVLHDTLVEIKRADLADRFKKKLLG